MISAIEKKEIFREYDIRGIYNEEMDDEILNKLVHRLGHDEGIKVVVDPEVLNPKEFLDTVLTKRLVNPFMPDTPQRIATDTSLKMPIRFGETIKSYIASNELDVKDLVYVPLTIAGWLRYLLAVDDKGENFTPSSDPMLATLQSFLKDVAWNDPSSLGDDIDQILKNEVIFGTDLVACGLSVKVRTYLAEMLEGEGSVRKTLQKYL